MIGANRPAPAQGVPIFDSIIASSATSARTLGFVMQAEKMAIDKRFPHLRVSCVCFISSCVVVWHWESLSINTYSSEGFGEMNHPQNYMRLSAALDEVAAHTSETDVVRRLPALR